MSGDIRCEHCGDRYAYASCCSTCSNKGHYFDIDDCPECRKDAEKLAKKMIVSGLFDDFSLDELIRIALYAKTVRHTSD